jgi:hypothetical protein
VYVYERIVKRLVIVWYGRYVVWLWNVGNEKGGSG